MTNATVTDDIFFDCLRLIKYDTFSEDVTKFYMAECILAIEAVHKLGFIHRCVAFPSN